MVTVKMYDGDSNSGTDILLCSPQYHIRYREGEGRHFVNPFVTML